MQFEEFTRAWDDYMTQYEKTAYNSIQRLKAEQEGEIYQLRLRF